MRTLFAAIVALCAMFTVSVPAMAATYRIDIEYETTGTPNPFIGSFTISNSFTSDLVSETAGLVVNNLSPGYGNASFNYRQSDDTIAIGDGLDGRPDLLTSPFDFALAIAGFRSATPSFAGLFVADDAANIVPVTSLKFSVTPVTAVPLPATGLLLLGAIGGLGLAARRRAIQGD